MTIASICQWFTLAVPVPTDKNRAVQMGCHLEEVAEMLDSVSQFDVAESVGLLADNYKHEALGVFALDRSELLDSLCDQIVTCIGIAHMHGLDIQGALAEVNRSNFSKFVDGKPLFDANGKIDKRHPGYSKPDLSAFLG